MLLEWHLLAHLSTSLRFLLLSAVRHLSVRENFQTPFLHRKEGNDQDSIYNYLIPSVQDTEGLAVKTKLCVVPTVKGGYKFANLSNKTTDSVLLRLSLFIKICNQLEWASDYCY